MIVVTDFYRPGGQNNEIYSLTVLGITVMGPGKPGVIKYILLGFVGEDHPYFSLASGGCQHSSVCGRITPSLSPQAQQPILLRLRLISASPLLKDTWYGI